MKVVSIQECSIKELESFSCGTTKLDRYLKEFAKRNDDKGYGKTYVLKDENKVYGYFTLATASISFENMPLEYINSNPKYPIPCIRLARLAISKDEQGKGLGKKLLTDAFLRIIDVSKSVGVKLVIVDAKETSVSFYTQYGFEQLRNESLTFYLPVDVLIKASLY